MNGTKGGEEVTYDLICLLMSAVYTACIRVILKYELLLRYGRTACHVCCAATFTTSGSSRRAALAQKRAPP